MKSKEHYLNLLSQFLKNRGSEYGISQMGIFGSVARDEANAQSDLDIFYVGQSMSLFRTCSLKEELENLLGRDVDIVRMRNEMNKFLQNQIHKEGLHV